MRPNLVSRCLIALLAAVFATRVHPASSEPAEVPRSMAGGAIAVGAKGGEAARLLLKDVACRDFKRRPVKLIEVPYLGDVGRAEFMGAGPVIKIDPAIMKSLPDTLQTFFALHECAHHALGHLFAPTTESEKEADCWAMKEGVRRKAFLPSDVDGWRPYFENSRGSAVHLPGPQRVTFLSACLSQD